MSILSSRAAVGALLLAVACHDALPPDALPPDAAPETPRPEPTVASTGGGYHITFSGIGTPDQTATVVADAAPGAPIVPATPVASMAAPDRGLTPRPNPSFPLELKIASTGFYSAGTRGTPGAYRYVYAMYRIRNGSGVTLRNLTLLGASGPTTFGGTAISNIKLPGDIVPAPATSAALALGMTPAGASFAGRTGEPVGNRPDVLQIFPEADLAAAPLPSPYVGLPYGFTVVDTTTTSRTIAPTGVGHHASLMLFAFKLPLQATASQDVMTFTFNFYAVTDAETRLTQSLEERDGAAANAVYSRASTIGATAIHVPRGSTIAGYYSARVFCGVRSAGVQGAATALLGTSCAGEIAAFSVSPTSVTLAPGATQQLTPTLTPVGGATPPLGVAYASANPAIATVSPTGLVTGVANGTTTIYAGPNASAHLAAIPVTVGSTALVFTEVAAAENHTCALTAEGKAYCWGWGGLGQLGDGLMEQRTAPVAVATPLRFTRLAVGDAHSCALTAGGEVYCWGAEIPTLQSGAPVVRLTPQALASSLRFASISADAAQTCALTALGKAYCWGLNEFGQLGDGTLENRRAPSPVVGDVTFASIDVGQRHACGRSIDGTVYCWGSNSSGQLGVGPTYRTAPSAVLGGLRFATIGTGTHRTCALTLAGKAFCWGSNYFGELGDGTRIPVRESPVPVATPLTFTRLATADQHSCAIATTGLTYCWGVQFWGELGNGTRNHTDAPTTVITDRVFSEIYTTSSSTCALTAEGKAYCWGSNQEGQIGDGTTTERLTPVAVATDVAFASLAGGWSRWCGLTAEGKAYCWGRLSTGATGPGTTPRAVVTGLTFASLNSNHATTCGVTPDGKAYCWGDDLAPAPFSPGTAFATLAVTGFQSCATTTSGTTLCWGLNWYGQVGDGTTTYRDVPTAVTGGLAFSGVSLGYAHTCALTAAGAAYCWGANASGELGIGLPAYASAPARTATNAAFTTVSAGAVATCGLTSFGATYCWGSVPAGGMPGLPLTQDIPAVLQSSVRFTAVDVGQWYGCGLSDAGRAYCWGSPSRGELGNGANSNSAQPVPVASNLTFTRLQTGRYHACALSPTSGAHCWGTNWTGQLGDGSTTDRYAPTPVAPPLP